MTIAIENRLRERAGSGIKALFNHLYELKFSRHVPLAVSLIFGLFAIWRTYHYLHVIVRMPEIVAATAAFAIEAGLLAAAAAVFISMRESYMRSLVEDDVSRARVFVVAAWLMFVSISAVLLTIAYLDALVISNDYAAAFVLTLSQFVQVGLLFFFVGMADLEERGKLRKELANLKATGCRYCGKEVQSNNRKRHEAACPLNPDNNAS